MSTDSISPQPLPTAPYPPQSAEFSAEANGFLEGQSKSIAADETSRGGWDSFLETIAAESYRIASMLVGDGEAAIGLIERVVTEIDLSTCSGPSQERQASRSLLAIHAVALLAEQDPSALAAPEGDSSPAGCIQDDDLEAAGVTPAELERMISGSEAYRLRNWIEGLSVSLRVVFVLRAVAGLSSSELAGLLAERGGPQALAWTPDAVRGTFRQALCSLASQLIHATATK